MRPLYATVDHVEVVDPLTVCIHMKEPYAFFLHMLAGYRTGLVLYSPTATHRKEIVNIAFKGKATPWVGMDPPGTLELEYDFRFTVLYRREQTGAGIYLQW
jgi:hypothetical protein